MSTILLNLDFGVPPQKKLEGNAKHQRFVKKRRLLEQRGLLNKKNQPPSKVSKSKVSKVHSQPSKKGETPTVDGTRKVSTQTQTKTAAAASGGSGSKQPLDKKAAVTWLTPAPSQKNHSAVAKIDLLGEFQSALPKMKKRPPRPKKPPPPPPPPPPPKNATQSSTRTHSERKRSKAAQNLPGKMVALDCEMVGTGPKGRVSSLARCSIVNYNGDVLYDEYIRPPCHIVDYRTRWSGIRKCHMVNATPFKTARAQILKVLKGKIVVGHAVHNDFKALQYFHPKSLTRDTSRIPLLNRKANFPENVTMSLKNLTKKLLQRDIQAGKSGHSSVEDAQATMELYKVVEVEWEQHLAQNPPQN